MSDTDLANFFLGGSLAEGKALNFWPGFSAIKRGAFWWLFALAKRFSFIFSSPISLYCFFCSILRASSSELLSLSLWKDRKPKKLKNWSKSSYFNELILTIIRTWYDRLRPLVSPSENSPSSNGLVGPAESLKIWVDLV